MKTGPKPYGVHPHRISLLRNRTPSSHTSQRMRIPMHLTRHTTRLPHRPQQLALFAGTFSKRRSHRDEKSEHHHFAHDIWGGNAGGACIPLPLRVNKKNSLREAAHIV